MYIEIFNLLYQFYIFYITIFKKIKNYIKNINIIFYIMCSLVLLSFYKVIFINKLSIMIKWNFFWFFILFNLDNISWLFIFLTILLFFLSFIAMQDRWYGIKYRSNTFIYLLFFLLVLLIGVFSVIDFLTFYILFEATLIPMFFIIGIWGSRQRKIHATYMFFLYTYVASIFFLIAIFILFSKFININLWHLLLISINLNQEYFLWFCFFFALCVKVPMFPFHIWLPEAHVEAPTIGSVLLAGILLKLGTYGMFRYLLPIFPQATIYFYPFVLLLCILAILYISYTTIRQIDLKKIIAYASIAHMAYVILGLFNTTLFGIIGSIYLMISHGLVSGALFFAIGVLYHRYHTRIIFYYNSLLYFMPIYGSILMILILSNMSFPGTSNFIGEFLIILGLIYDNIFICIISIFCIIPSAVYSIWFFNRLMGGIIPKFKFYSDISFNEFFILVLLIFYIIIGGLFPMLVIERLEYLILQSLEYIYTYTWNSFLITIQVHADTMPVTYQKFNKDILLIINIDENWIVNNFYYYLKQFNFSYSLKI